jgi:hypothetical protein
MDPLVFDEMHRRAGIENAAQPRIVADRAAPLNPSHKAHFGHRYDRVPHDEVIKESYLDQ